SWPAEHDWFCIDCVGLLFLVGLFFPNHSFLLPFPLLLPLSDDCSSQGPMITIVLRRASTRSNPTLSRLFFASSSLMIVLLRAPLSIVISFSFSRLFGQRSSFTEPFANPRLPSFRYFDQKPSIPRYDVSR
ncbi:hypothetical protein ACHAWF_008935, partial [Thalassiosira exigua]